MTNLNILVAFESFAKRKENSKPADYNALYKIRKLQKTLQDDV